MLRRRTMILMTATAMFATACDRTPVDPTDGGSDIGTVLFGSEAARYAVPPLSLPALVQAAVLKVYTEHGADAARAVVTDLRRLQDRASGGAVDPELSRAQLQALHDEQLAIVLRIFGDDVVIRLIEAVRTDASAIPARLGQLDASRPSTARAAGLVAQVAELLADAETAAANGAYRAALDNATRAAAGVDAIRTAVAESMRVPSLDELFDLAVAEPVRGAPVTSPLLVEYRRLQQAAQQAVRTDNRERAQAALQDARAAQIQVVLSVLGEDVLRRLLRQAADARAVAVTEVAEARRSGRDVHRIERMLAAAGDLADRAGIRLAEGDAAAALDLAAHAVGLINAARLALGPG